MHINSRKVFGTVLGIVVFVSFALYFTYAWYNWRSGNNTVTFTIKDASTECTNGVSIDVKNIGPVLNVKDGVKFDFAIKNTGSEDINMTLGFNLTSISSNLKVESFKYLVVTSTASSSFNYSSPILSGNFKSLSVGNNTLTSSLKVLANQVNYYQFVVYIDGNVPNPEEMMSGSLVGEITYGDCGALKQKLASVEVGSYVKYTGNNGCSGKACEGQNANYVSSSNMGYCDSSSYKFNSSGWRVAYISDGTAYLTSGGAPECMCTDSSGNAGTSCSDWETTAGVPKHLANLNAKALTYCNSTYAYGGVCNSSSTWNMNDNDFQKITGDTLDIACNQSSGYYNNYSIINNGSHYWFATPLNASGYYPLYWRPDFRRVSNVSSNNTYGVRPVLRLNASVIVTGGSGTMEDPYEIGVEG